VRVRGGGLSLIELLAGCAAIIILLSAIIPSTGRVRELSKRSVCAVNLAGIGAAAQVYAASNNGSWPVPAFRNASIGTFGIQYLRDNNGVGGPGQTGYKRLEPTTSETEEFPNAGSTEVAVTRAFWMLARSGDVPLKQFICPSRLGDVPDPAEDIELYYDFFDYRHVSYGYQVPFGPPDTRPREGMDKRQAVAADKGPFYLDSGRPSWLRPGTQEFLDLHHVPRDWQAYNSPDHGGAGSGEGQNVLFPDGYAEFVRIPAVGVDDDNIYTLMTNRWSILPYNRIHGETPHERRPPPYPGQNALGTRIHATTDSLIFP
jgi:hypothetical protein